MTKLMLLFVPVLMITAIAHAAPKAEKPNLPGVKCDLVKKMALADLPKFCRSKELDKRRLVDYGFQLSALDNCGEKELGKNVQEALHAKIHRDDRTTCAEIAANLND